MFFTTTSFHEILNDRYKVSSTRDSRTQKLATETQWEASRAAQKQHANVQTSTDPHVSTLSTQAPVLRKPNGEWDGGRDASTAPRRRMRIRYRCVRPASDTSAERWRPSPSAWQARPLRVRPSELAQRNRSGLSRSGTT